MLLIANKSCRESIVLNDVVREMSLALSLYSGPAQMKALMAGESRRIVLLSEDDVSREVVAALKDASGRTPFGVMIAADRSALWSSDRQELVDKLMEFDNLEWLGKNYDFDQLAASARRCRRRLLKLSRQDLENAFDNFEFVIRYQPKVERGSGAEWVTREAEALVRWRHPEHGLVGPLEFLPEIEAFGMMGRLTEYVLRKAAAQLVVWHAQGLSLKSCVNLAPSLLNDPSIAEAYKKLVGEFKLTPASFTLEVVEQDLATVDAPHNQTLNALRERGFRICLDDFRVAAASLGTFDKLPFDEIKIHASAIRRARQDTRSMAVLAAVTGLAHNLGMSVCAEGVEDQETFDFLKTIECDKMQGFLISEAVLPDIIRRVYSADPKAANEDVA